MVQQGEGLTQVLTLVVDGFTGDLIGDLPGQGSARVLTNVDLLCGT